MSTTRHLINRQRRRQARDGQPATTAPEQEATRTAPVDVLPAEGTAVRLRAPRPREADAETSEESGSAQGLDTAPAPEAESTEPAGARDKARRGPAVALAVLCVLTLLLGAFAGLAHSRATALRDDPARTNTALTDPARTSDIKGQTGKAVAALFSYDYAAPDAAEKAARTLLTGKAVAQHKDLIGGVLAQAAKQKTVITTTVTDSAVERIDGDRARVLVYADQSSVSTAAPAKPAKGKKATGAPDQGVYAGAMFAVDVVERNGRWIVEGIDTFGR
ncbi:hypothetical protein ABT160_05495 [Streptomyces sp. NPDC001941]|uniref:hypothetical protein n=1 Tax=Streptomyces sp. NPDC001941 TaxID=3154659 RepID=UPI003329B5C1